MYISKLKKDFELICLSYVEMFEKKHGLEFHGWISSNPGTIAQLSTLTSFSDYYINFEYIRHDINTNQPKENFINWYNLCIKAEKFKFNYATYCNSLKPKDV